jgi:hypothetical protein
MLMLNLVPVGVFAIEAALGRSFAAIELAGAGMVIGALAANNLYLRGASAKPLKPGRLEAAPIGGRVVKARQMQTPARFEQRSRRATYIVRADRLNCEQHRCGSAAILL